MTKAILTLSILLILALTTTVEAQRDKREQGDDDDVIRVSTTLVTVPVSVMDRDGRFIADLQKEDFRLYEEGVEQEIAFFETADKPFTVALLLDISDSTKFKLKDIQDAANAFLTNLRPADRVIIVAFDKGVYVLAEATSNRRVLETAISKVQTGGGTSLYTAVDEVIRKRMSRISGRKAIVLFTDGVDTNSTDSTYHSTLRAAEELDALAYPIQFNTYDDLMLAQAALGSINRNSALLVTSRGERLDVAYKRANRYLIHLASTTGGRIFYAHSPKDLQESFRRIAEELRRQYSLGFYPTAQAAGESRQLKVRVNRLGVVVRARKSYAQRKPRR